jgi:predicted phosphodiesterase
MSSAIAFLSDIHGNSPALKAVLEDIRDQGCSQVFMLGDLINGVDPHGCVQALRQWQEVTNVELTCLKGNGEAYLLTPERDALPRQTESWNTDMIRLADWWEAHLTREDIEWIHTFQDFILWNDACLVHDRPMDRLSPESWHVPELETRYQEWFFHSPGIHPDLTDEEWQTLWTYMDSHNFSQVFCGHTHIPFCREFKGKAVCNLGSAGATLDGDPRASWVKVEQLPGNDLIISIRRVDYDIALIHQLIDQTPDYYGFQVPGYTEAYKKWFSTGIHWKVHLASR